MSCSNFQKRPQGRPDSRKDLRVPTCHPLLRYPPQAAIGANATNVLQIPTEYRHFAWSIGGHGSLADIITLPNILKTFNPNIVGFAKRSTVSYRPAELEDAGLNLAITGANSILLPQQARHLIDTLKTLPDVNYKEDWKVITIFIGGNDLCDFCKNKTLYSAESFILSVTESLDMLQNELPRSIVNVVQLFEISQLRQINDRTVSCVLQRIFCSCVVQPKDDSPELLEVLDQNRKFQNMLEDVIEKSGRYDGKRDFAVVLQPFLQNMQPPTDPEGGIDYSFFTPDCFHPTMKAHEQMAKALWNNMLQPRGEKSLLNSFSEDVQLLCPSQEHPYIYTRTPEYTYDASDDVLGGSGSLTALCMLVVTALLGTSS
ncbi:phospholipase B1, membrane-associated-like isoform X2 [Hyperolius riggenbachi]|uniref:phospholipase B1, membrane-associated-like isoform X2 n=1 Tax=Hyperolius riggenbachi TaxID=752182 RepID=UPI0035A39DBD